MKTTLLALVSLALFMQWQRCPAMSLDTDSLLKRVILEFKMNDTVLRMDYGGNREALREIEMFIGSNSRWKTERISMAGISVPDGDAGTNVKLARSRAEAIYRRIRQMFPENGISPADVGYESRTWDELLPVIQNDPQVPCRGRILSVLQSDLSDACKLAKVRLLSKEAYLYIKEKDFPGLRNSIICEMVLKPDPARTPVVFKETPIRKTLHRKPLFAIKTNMLLDAVTAVNAEIEVPLGKRWSVSGEVICPWWLSDRKQYCLQVLSGNVEGKYWFGDRELRKDGSPRMVMTGWFAGIYAGGGLYDVEWGTEGYQGNFFMAGGISGGYAHSIGKQLRLEYTLGVGYFKTAYEYYKPVNGGEKLVWQYDGNYSFTGITRAKISLVWMLTCKNRRGGAGR